MSRQTTTGLDFAPLDIDMFQDIRIRKLIRRQGGKAVTVYVLLLCFIYKNGYYIGGDKDLPFILSEQTGYKEDYIHEVLESCFSLGLFSQEMYDTYNIITSRDIQLRYKKVCSTQKKKQGRIKKEFDLLIPEKSRSNVQESDLNAGKSGIIPEKSRQEKGKEKEKEKEKENSPLIIPYKEKEKEKFAVVAVNARVREEKNFQQEEFLRRFFDDHPLQIQSLCMQLHTDVLTLRESGRQVLTEWELTAVKHNDYSDMARHLINHLRIKIRENQRYKNYENKQRYDNRRGEADIGATSAQDYKTTF